MNDLLTRAANCIKNKPVEQTSIDPEIVAEYSFDLIIAILYLYIIVPVTGQAKLSDYMIVFTVYSFTLLHILSFTCLSGMQVIIYSTIFGLLIAVISLKEKPNKFIQPLAEFTILFLAIAKIDVGYGIAVHAAVHMIGLILYILLIKRIGIDDRKIFLRALTCTFLLGFLANTDTASKYISYILFFMSYLPSIVVDCITKVGFILTIIFHFIFLKYKGRFYSGEEAKELLPV